MQYHKQYCHGSHWEEDWGSLRLCAQTFVVLPQVVFLPHKKKKNFCWDMTTLVDWKQVCSTLSSTEVHCTLILKKEAVYVCTIHTMYRVLHTTTYVCRRVVRMWSLSHSTQPTSFPSICQSTLEYWLTASKVRSQPPTDADCLKFPRRRLTNSNESDTSKLFPRDITSLLLSYLSLCSSLAPLSLLPSSPLLPSPLSPLSVKATES